MSKPDQNWEEHWRETLAEHKAGPPSSADWSGMEQLLDAKVVPVSPIKTPAPVRTGRSTNLPALPWPFWALVLTLVLALGYWLGNRTPDEPILEMESTQQQTNTTTIAPRIDTVYLFDPDSKLNGKILSIDKASSTKNTPSSPSRPGPEINTPETAGGDTSAPPATSPPAATPAQPSPAPLPPPSGAGAERRSGNLAPAVLRPNAADAGPDMSFSSPDRPARLNRARYTPLLETLSPPTDRELWERRATQIVLSGDLIITPVRFHNGYFPPYRPRQ